MTAERGSADLGAALELASSIVAREHGARIVVLGDGGERVLGLAAEIDGVPISERRLAAPTPHNLGISVLSTRPPADAQSDDEREALIVVTTSSDEERVAAVTLAADGHELARRRLKVAAKGDVETRIRVRASSSRMLPVEAVRELAGAETRFRSLESNDALLRGVSLDGITIERALAAKAPATARALLELDGGSVILSGGAGSSSWVYLGFDPGKSDLPLRVAFPVLVANALHVLGGAANVVSADTVTRREIALQTAALVPTANAAAEEAAPTWRFPASPAVLLAGVAALLLAFEACTYRKGWA